MTLSKGHQLIGAGEIVRIGIAIRPRMNRTKLRFILRLQLTELRTENRGIVRFGKVPGSGCGADLNMPSLASLTQRRGGGRGSIRLRLQRCRAGLKSQSADKNCRSDAMPGARA